jgi:HlyD family secretion protein
MKMTRTTWIAAAAGLGAVAALAWAMAPKPVPVELAAASAGRFEATIDEDGRTRLADRYVVSTPLAGKLARITLREGDTIEAGAPVASIAPSLPPLRDARTVQELAARVEGARALLQRAQAHAESARIAQQQADSDATRSERLAAEGYIAPTRLEADRRSARAARAAREAAVQEQRAAEQDLAQARAAQGLALRPDSAGRDSFVVRSPVAGRVLRVVQNSEAIVGAGTALVEVGDLARLEVIAELLTPDALRAAPGTRVVIERWGGPQALEGRVRRVEPAAYTKVSALGIEEQRVEVLIEILSPHADWQALGDGYRVGVRIVTTSVADALRVPVSAVFPLATADGDADSAVFVVEGGRARRVPVRVGGRNGSEAWVTQGLSAGALVVVYPSAAVKDGVRVAARKV